MTAETNTETPFRAEWDDPFSDLFQPMTGGGGVEFPSPVPHDDFESLVGLDTIQRAYSELAKECTTEALSIIPGIPSYEEVIKFKPLDLVLTRNGVSLKTIYPESARRADYLYDVIREVGSEVRTSKITPARLTIVDRKVAMISSESTGTFTKPISYRTRVNGAVSSLCALFDVLWQQSTPFFLEASIKAETLNEREYLVLSGLVAGWNDQQIARLINRGERTVQREINALLAVFGTNSRLTLAIEAHRLGIRAASV